LLRYSRKSTPGPPGTPLEIPLPFGLRATRTATGQVVPWPLASPGGDARRFLHSHGSFPQPMHNPDSTRFPSFSYEIDCFGNIDQCRYRLRRRGCGASAISAPS
jgi:hypothetical protein